MTNMLIDGWNWIIQLGNAKIASLLIFFPLFVSIVIYVYSSSKRSAKFESYRYIPFQDEDSETEKNQGKPK